jgi:hypothetical protein
MEAIYSSETSDLTRAIRRNISEDYILHGHRCENLRSYNSDYSADDNNRNSININYLKLS